VEASTLGAPPFGRRVSLPPALLRLRSDDQLLALFRAGNDDAFGALHDRYRQRLFAYVRQMLAGGSRQDAEDVLQDVFVRAFRALRGDEREVNVRAWLYRVAHNRCIDHLRRPEPPAPELIELSSRKPLHDPLEEAERREHLKQLVADVARLPDQQRSALLMREIDGLSYADMAGALDVTVPAVKSLLVRARVGLVEAAEARDADCGLIRRDLVSAYDRGVKASGRARRHLRECEGCREYRGALRGVRRSFAALAPPVAAGPLALAAKLLGVGGAGGGAVAGGSAAAGGGATASAVVGGGGLAVTTCKVAAVVCAGAALTGGAAEVRRLVEPARAPAARSAPAPAAAAVTAEPHARGAPVPAAVLDRPPAAARSRPERTAAAAAPAAAAEREEEEPLLATEPASAVAPEAGTLAPETAGAPVLVLPADDEQGGVAAPSEEPVVPPAEGEGTTVEGGGPATPPAETVAEPAPQAAPAPTAHADRLAPPEPVRPAESGGVAAPG